VNCGKVTAFIAARKTLLGRPQWTTGSRVNQFRLIWPVAIDGVGLGPQLEATYSAHAPHLKLSVILNLPPAVARVDLDETGIHTNRHPRPQGVPRQVIGHNYHSWPDNRPKAASSPVPRNLRVARALDSQLAVYPGVLLWFCEQLNIEVNPDLIPLLPERETLL